jgi:hypothetical protein
MNEFSVTSDCDALDTYVAGVDELHSKLARIAGHHQDIAYAMQRIADSLRAMSNAHRS